MVNFITHKQKPKNREVRNYISNLQYKKSKYFLYYNNEHVLYVNLKGKIFISYGNFKYTKDLSEKRAIFKFILYNAIKEIKLL